MASWLWSPLGWVIDLNVGGGSFECWGEVGGAVNADLPFFSLKSTCKAWRLECLEWNVCSLFCYSLLWLFKPTPTETSRYSTFSGRSAHSAQPDNVTVGGLESTRAIRSRLGCSGSRLKLFRSRLGNCSKFELKLPSRLGVDSSWPGVDSPTSGADLAILESAFPL